MTTQYDILLSGFPGKCGRGFLGWSTTVLLKTRAGYALFDTGGAGDRPGILEGLAKRGVDTRDIRTVIVSHLHFDHIANAECFPDADIVIHEAELSYFDRHWAHDRAVPKYLVEGLLRRPQLSVVSGELDILPGVRMIRTPGHTGGHIALVLQIDGECVVLAQDALKHRGEVATSVSAGAFDAKAASASIQRIVGMADIIVPGHDAPFRIHDGAVVLPGRLHEEIRITIDDRLYEMEVG